MEGILHITIIEGKGFAPRDKTGFSDPYCVITVNGIKHEQTTKVVLQTNDPKFDEKFKVKITNAHEVKYEKLGEVVIDVWDWDRLAIDDFVGRAVIPMSDIEEAKVDKWYPLVAKPHFHDPVTGEIHVVHKIEWKSVPVQNLSSVTRIQQKVGAKLSQISRIGADYLGKKYENIVSWSARSRQIWNHMHHLKPPKFAYCSEMAMKFKDTTHFDKEELELLFYAFRSFSYPEEQINRQKFARVFPTIGNNEIIFALFNAFNLDPQDDITFSEFVQSLSHVTRGNQYQRLHMVSRFYEQAGSVSKARFMVLTRNTVNVLKSPLTDEVLNSLAKQIFGDNELIAISKFMVHLHTMDTKKDDTSRKLDESVEDAETDFGIGNCFGLFHYLYESTIELIEQMVSGTDVKPEKEGFLLKKSGSSWAKYWFVLRDGFLFYYRDPSDDHPARVVFLGVDAGVDNAPDFETAEDNITPLMDSMSNPLAQSRSRTISKNRRSGAFNPTPSSTFSTFHHSTLSPSPSTTFSLSPSPSTSLSLSNSPSTNLSISRPMLSSASSIPSSPDISFEGESLSITVSVPTSNDVRELAQHAEGTAYVNAANTSVHANAAKQAANSPTPNIAVAVSSASASSNESAATAQAAAHAADALKAATEAAELAASKGNIEAAYEAAQIASTVAAAFASAAQSAAAAAASAAVAWSAARMAEQAIASIPPPPPLPENPLTSPLIKQRRFVAHKVAPSKSKLQPLQESSETAIDAKSNSSDSSLTASKSASGKKEKPPPNPSNLSRIKAHMSSIHLKKAHHFIPTPDNTFKLMAGPYTMILTAKNEKHKQKWMERVSMHTPGETMNPHGSFAPARPFCSAEFYVDGEDYYKGVEQAILKAREQVFITDWFLSPEVYLNRDLDSGMMKSRLDHLLKERAKEGIKIYIIVWNETKLALNLNSERVKSVLEGLDKNITVICHPVLLMKWSHHQKTVIVDQDVAFLGGLDMCFGRYDTHDHKLEDPTAKVFPGKDYYNPSRGGDFDALEYPFKDLVQRARVPRMPWHDVSVRVEGYAARDVAKNFIQRWNHHRDQIQMSSRLLIPKSTLWPYRDTKNCQILRSLSEWSGQGSAHTESSIHAAMVASIQQAKHCIYIENQYFISNSAGGKVRNEIASALVARIRTAIIERRLRSLPYPNFRVIVVLPVHPEGTYKDSMAIRYIMKWQYGTICRGGHSILEQLQREYPDENLNSYISFHALRNYGILEGLVVTEQIYVHTKLMIVDDKRIIVGSANINDRSLAGDRDSEIAILIDDEELVSSKMAGRPFMAGKMALSLRQALWREHLGLSDDLKITDPVIPESFENLWQATSRANTSLYTQVFGQIEGDTVESIRDIAHQRKPLASIEVKGILNQIKGHLVDYPLNFLVSSLQESFSSLDIVVAGDEVFQ